MRETKIIIRDFLSNFFRKHDLKDDEEISAYGVVNSLFAMQLAMFLEREFNIIIDSDDLKFDKFRTISIDGIERLIREKSTGNEVVTVEI
jgi:acyl carrier protein